MVGRLPEVNRDILFITQPLFKKYFKKVVLIAVEMLHYQAIYVNSKQL